VHIPPPFALRTLHMPLWPLLVPPLRSSSLHTAYPASHPLLPHGCVPATCCDLVLLRRWFAGVGTTGSGSANGNPRYLVLLVRSTLRSTFQPTPGTSNLVPSAPCPCCCCCCCCCPRCSRCPTYRSAIPAGLTAPLLPPISAFGTHLLARVDRVVVPPLSHSKA
jgi:hypothetical protein